MEEVSSQEERIKKSRKEKEDKPKTGANKREDPNDDNNDNQQTLTRSIAQLSPNMSNANYLIFVTVVALLVDWLVMSPNWLVPMTRIDRVTFVPFWTLLPLAYTLGSYKPLQDAIVELFLTLELLLGVFLVVFHLNRCTRHRDCSFSTLYAVISADIQDTPVSVWWVCQFILLVFVSTVFATIDLYLVPSKALTRRDAQGLYKKLSYPLLIVSLLSHGWAYMKGVQFINLISFNVGNETDLVATGAVIFGFFIISFYTIPDFNSGDSYAGKWFYRFILYATVLISPSAGLVYFLGNHVHTETQIREEPNEAEPKKFWKNFANFVVYYQGFVSASVIGYAIGNLAIATIYIILVVLLVISGYGIVKYSWASGLEKWVKNHQIRTFTLVLASAGLLAACWRESQLMPSTIRVMGRSVGGGYFYVLLLVYTTYRTLSEVRSWLSGKPSLIPRGIIFANLVIFFLFAAISWLTKAHACTLEVGKEYVHPKVEAAFDEYKYIIESAVEKKSFGGQEAFRLQHGKTHGCLRGEFEIENRLSHNLIRGIFQPTTKYPVYFRLSNNRDPDKLDYDIQVRGLSMKVMGVNGTRAMDCDHCEKHTQDFLFVSSDYFFTNDHDSYPALLRASTHPRGFLGLIPWIFSSANPVEWVSRAYYFFWMIRMGQEGKEVINLLHWNYYSATPYALGEGQAVKYSLRPCSENKNEELDKLARLRDPKSFLRTNLERDVGQNGACFDFYVQLQTDACEQPIENPIISWEGAWSKVGTIKFKPQKITRRDFLDFCEDMNFNPWNSIIEHKPLGTINRVRKISYLASGMKRLALNNRPFVEPNGKEKFSGDIVINPLVGAGNTEEYQYTTYPAPFHRLPKHIVRLPSDQEFDRKYFGLVQRTYINTKLIFYGKDTSNYTTPYDYEKFFQGVDPILQPPNIKYWNEDWYFAWAYLAGVHPNAIHHVSESISIPEIFNLTSKGIAYMNKVLSPKTTFEKLMQQKKLFFVDYKAMENITMKEDRVFYAPIVLLYLNETNGLMPLAIQLTRNRNGANELYTPAEENPLVWMYAKMHVQTADAQVHEMITHLGFTHLAMEPIIIGFYRQLAQDHPIMKLMKPHFRYTLAINDFGRLRLLSPGDVFDVTAVMGLRGALELVQNAYLQTYNLTERAFPRELKKRGFVNVELGEHDVLPRYYYRDDGFRIWNALESYVRSVLLRKEVYGPRDGKSSDELVKEDKQLQALRRELADPLFANVPGVPYLHTLEDVVEFLTNLIFTCSAQHSAANFGQYHYYAYVPGRPGTLYKLMPKDRSQVTYPFIMSAMPTKHQAVESVAAVAVLSLSPTQTSVKDEETGGVLGDILTGIRNQVAFLEEYNKLLGTLKKLDREIETRNTDLPIKYDYLMPSKIASAISI